MGIDVPKKRSVVLDTLHRIHQKAKGNSVDLASAKAAYGHYLSYEMGQEQGFSDGTIVIFSGGL
jgi:hypothetical protein